MSGSDAETGNEPGWVPIEDAEGRYSSGIPDLDRLLGGGYVRGGLALFNIDPSVGPEDEDLVFTPLYLNFLYQSRGMIAVLPSRDTPHGFRARVTRYASRRRFDSRVRIVVYVDEDTDAPYVVYLPVGGRNEAGGKATEAQRERQVQEGMQKMLAAEKAAQGERKRSFLEVNAFEVVETVLGAETATRMFFHGVKRARAVGNLVVGRVRPGLRCAEAVRAMADAELELRRDDVGVVIRGIRPRFPPHVLVTDRALGAPHAMLVPSPGAVPAPAPDGVVATPTSSSGRTRRR